MEEATHGEMTSARASYYSGTTGAQSSAGLPPPPTSPPSPSISSYTGFFCNGEGKKFIVPTVLRAKVRTGRQTITQQGAEDIGCISSLNATTTGYVILTETLNLSWLQHVSDDDKAHACLL